MAVKHFVIDPSIKSIGKENTELIQKERVEKISVATDNHEQRNKELMTEEDNLTHVHERVIIKINTQGKNSHTFESGLTIRRERNFNNFNKRETQPVNGYVISAEYIPKGCEVLISHNALHDSNRIFNYKDGKEDSTDIRYFSIPEYECFAWRDKDGKLKPMRNFEFGLKVYKPYTGRLTFITPILIKDTLWVTTGEFKNKVVHTLPASDYIIVYQNINGQEAQVIRFRHSNEYGFDREEVVAISHDLTEQVNNGTLNIGLTPENCKPFNEYYG